MSDLVYWLVVLLAFIAGGTVGGVAMALLAASASVDPAGRDRP